MNWKKWLKVVLAKVLPVLVKKYLPEKDGTPDE